MNKSTKIILGSIAGIVFIGGCGSVMADGDEKTADPAVVQTDKPVEKDAAEKTEAPKKEESPVKLSGEAVPFVPSILHDGDKYTSVRVTIANDSDKKISVNPLDFTITDTNGTKHSSELGMAEDQMDVMDLAPGENTSGVITGKGDWKAAYVTYTDGWFGVKAIRGNVK